MEDKKNIEIETDDYTKTESENYYSVNKTIINALASITERCSSHEQKNEKYYLDTGFNQLFMKKGDLIILASRPGIGKTSFGLSLIYQLSIKNNIPVGLVMPGNMDKARIGERLISFDTELTIRQINLNVEALEKIRKSSLQIYGRPFFIFNEPNCCFEQIKTSVIQMAMDKHIQLLIVDSFDYIQEIVDSDPKEYRNVFTSMLDKFKNLAASLHIPVILEIGLPCIEDEEIPALSHFKKYMIIPEKADMVLFLHRGCPLEYDAYQEAFLLIDKDSSGLKKTIPLYFYPPTGIFMNKDE